MASLSNINGIFDVHSTGAILFNTSHGTSGQILKSNGNAAPTWVAASTVIGGPYLPLSGGTLTGATATASGISFTVGGTLTGTSATFSGNVGIGATGLYSTARALNLPGKGISFKNDLSGSNNNWSYIYNTATGSSSNLVFATGQSLTALTLAHSGNATFVGNVGVGGKTPVYGLSLAQGTSASNKIVWTDVTPTFAASIYANSANDRLTFSTKNPSGVETTALEIDTSQNATFAGEVLVSGDIYQYGSIFRTSSFMDVVGNRNSKIELGTPYFTNGDSNQAVNIQFPNVAMQGYYKITLSGSYSHQDISGKLTKVIPFGYNPDGGIWRTGSSQSEITIATGGVSTNFTIGNLAWDSTNSKFIIPIYKLTSSGNSVKILIEYFGGAANNLKDVTLSAKYTQTAPSPFNVRQYQYIQDRLGVGTISPSVKFQVQHDQTAESNVIFMNNSTGSNAAMRLSLNVGSPAGHDPMISFNIGDGGLDWTMGLDNSDGDKFKISGGTDSHNPNLGANDRFVITSTGFTKLKNDGDATWDGYNFHAISNSVVSQPTVMVYNSASSGNQYGVNVIHTSTNANTTGRFFLGATNNGASERIKIYTNGNIQNTNNSYGQLSDVNLKENIVNATPKLDEINQLRIVNFNYIGDDLKQIGVVAQELEQTFPGLVDEVEHTQDGETSMVKSVKYSVFVPMLIKAIQELEARVKELENK